MVLELPSAQGKRNELIGSPKGATTSRMMRTIALFEEPKSRRSRPNSQARMMGVLSNSKKSNRSVLMQMG